MRHTSRTSIASVLAWVVALLCFCSVTPSWGQNGDSLDIQSVRPSGPLRAGGRATLQVKAQYSLQSTNQATLAIYVEEYPASAGGCSGNVHQTNGGTDFRIFRGQGTPSVSVTWRGDSPAYQGGGYLTIGANFNAGNRLVQSFGTFNQYCYRFSGM